MAFRRKKVASTGKRMKFVRRGKGILSGQYETDYDSTVETEYSSDVTLPDLCVSETQRKDLSSPMALLRHVNEASGEVNQTVGSVSSSKEVSRKRKRLPLIPDVIQLSDDQTEQESGCDQALETSNDFVAIDFDELDSLSKCDTDISSIRTSYQRQPILSDELAAAMFDKPCRRVEAECIDMTLSDDEGQENENATVFGLAAVDAEQDMDNLEEYTMDNAVPQVNEVSSSGIQPQKTCRRNRQQITDQTSTIPIIELPSDDEIDIQIKARLHNTPVPDIDGISNRNKKQQTKNMNSNEEKATEKTKDNMRYEPVVAKSGDVQKARELLLQNRSGFIVYDEDGKTRAERSDVDFQQAPHTAKRLHEQKKPAMKMCSDLRNITKNHKMIRDNTGHLSIENDNVARYMLDIALLFKETAKGMSDDALSLQHKISELRAEEQLQLKQEIGEDEQHDSEAMTSIDKSKKKSRLLKPNNRAQTAEQVIKRKFICQLCGSSYVHESDLETHTNKHFDRMLVCSSCGKGFYSNLRLTLHEKCHDEGFLKCSQCPKEYVSKSSLMYHFKQHKQLPFVCTIAGCNGSFVNKSSWKTHVRYGHLTERTCPCDICGKFFQSPSVVSSHKSRDH